MRIRSYIRAIVDEIRSPEQPTPLDPEFYRSRYADLRHLSPKALRRHFYQHGLREGRVGWPGGAGPAQNGLTALPPDFEAAVYLSLNPDLRSSGVTAVEAASHYRAHGAREGRPYRRFNSHVYRELYFGGQQISDQSLEREFDAVGRGQGRIASGVEYLARQGRSGAFWADSIILHEFRLLNWKWAGQTERYIDALETMLREGVDRQAALSFELQFEPEYYRDAHPAMGGNDDRQLYHHWLWEDGAATPGSSTLHLKDLRLSLQTYPPGFQWREYAQSYQGLGNRWAALDHLMKIGLPAGVVPPVSGADAADFLIALSQTMASRDDFGAIRLLEKAQSLSPLSGSAMQWLGDCHLRLEHWQAALDCYSATARGDEPVVWSFCNGAKAAIRLDRPDRAILLLSAGKESFSGEQVWRTTGADAIQAEFDQSWRRAEEHYQAGDRREGDAIMTRAAVRSGELWAALDPLGIPLPAHPDGRVVMLANVDLAQCTHYRVDQKAELFEALERPYAIFSQAEVEDFITALAGASAAIFYRLPATPKNIRAIQIARNMQIPTYYDIDDLLFDVNEYPEPLETYSMVSNAFYASLQMGVPLFREAMALCDYGISSTTDLARHMAKVVRTGIAHVLPNGLDHNNAFYLDNTPKRTRRDGEFVIFYGSGTKAHNSDFLDLAGRGLNVVMRKYPHIRLVIVGYLELDESFDDLRDRVTYIDWVPDLKAYWSILIEADLNIAVLADHATTNAKSEIKWIEAAALGLPSVVSATHRYKEVLEHGVDALIAADAEEWAVCLEQMVVDPALRERLVENARRKLRSTYTIKENSKNLAALLPAVTNGSGDRRKPRILLVNLFFPPQTVGGSTRVTRDNLDYFISNVGDELDFAVATTDLHAEIPYRLRVEDYRGAPVFRISTPPELNMEWRPFNPEIKRIFNDVLTFWEPDLVHFHCVQRLSASIVEACRERGVPYLNTLHDAFWVSDYQFLSDAKDRLRTPMEPWPLEPPPPISVGESLSRRRYLQPLLSDSAEILGVSKSFTQLYRECGYERAICVANGVPPMPRVERTTSKTGRVRLAQVGSQTYYKGYHHLQAALKQNSFKNLELTVIDHSRYGGAHETTCWGETIVHFVGKTRQERMQEFYADMDVLIATSLWPESFGLVSREALNSGLWVIASDRGAMGEDVTAGHNGWVVDVSTPAGLADVLAKIDQNPERYMASPPPPEPPLRTADDQGRDLVAVYREVLARPRPEPKTSPFKPTPPKAVWSLEASAERAQSHQDGGRATA